MRYKELPKVKIRHNRDGSKSWWAEWFEPGKPRKHRSIVLGNARSLTKQAAKERLQDALEDTAPTSTTWTVKRYVSEVWLPTRLKRWARKTVNAMTSVTSTHVIPGIGDMLLGDVRKFHLEAWLGSMATAGYGRDTGQMALTISRSIFDDALENDLIAKNPARKVVLPTMRPTRETVPYTLDEVRLLTATPGAAGLILRVLLFCGLRPGEVLALRRNDLQGGILTVDESTDYAEHYKGTKTGTVRRVGLPPGLAHDLTALASTVEPDGLLFTQAATVGGLRRWVERKVGVTGFNLRRCRTTFASLVEMDVRDIQAVLGHGNAAMTLDRYAKGSTARQTAAAAVFEALATGREETEAVQ
jgi:integrase